MVRYYVYDCELCGKSVTVSEEKWIYKCLDCGRKICGDCNQLGFCLEHLLQKSPSYLEIFRFIEAKSLFQQKQFEHYGGWSFFLFGLISLLGIVLIFPPAFVLYPLILLMLVISFAAIDFRAFDSDQKIKKLFPSITPQTTLTTIFSEEELRKYTPFLRDHTISLDTLSYYHICSKCQRFNPPKVDYCQNCGEVLPSLKPKPELPQKPKPRLNKIELSTGFFHTSESRQKIIRCPYCGKIMNPKFRNCLECGTKIKKSIDDSNLL